MATFIAPLPSAFNNEAKDLASDLDIGDNVSATFVKSIK